MSGGAGRGSRPARERERGRGGQTRVETALGRFIIAFNLTEVQLLNPGTPEHEYQHETAAVSPAVWV